MSSEPAGTPHPERAANIIPLAGSTRPYWLGHLRDHVLRQGLRDCLRRERGATAELLAHIAEFDARQLYSNDTCSSMFDYCVRKLHMSEDTALKRIRVARTAREFPAIFPLLADGRLTLTAVVLLTPRLSAANADALLAAAVHRTKSQLELLLATSFQHAVVPAQPMLPMNSGNEVVPEPPVPSDSRADAHSGEPLFQAAAEVDDAHTDTGFAFVASETDVPLIDDATGNAIASQAAEDDLTAPPSVPANVAANRDALAETDLVAIAPQSHGLALYLRFTPVSANCASLKGMLSLQAMREFKRLQELAGSFGASAAAAELLEKAIKAYADALEKRKFGARVGAGARASAGGRVDAGARASAGGRAGAGARASASARAGASKGPGANASASPSTRAKHTDPKRRRIPSAIRRAVYDRDHGQCTFQGSDGTRCACRTALEFDHIQPLARGGLSTVANLRLRCRAHNQLEARRAFGERFVKAKQEQARARAGSEHAHPSTNPRTRRAP